MRETAAEWMKLIVLNFVYVFVVLCLIMYVWNPYTYLTPVVCCLPLLLLLLLFRLEQIAVRANMLETSLPLLLVTHTWLLRHMLPDCWGSPFFDWYQIILLVSSI